MKSVLDALPGVLMPDAAAEAQAPEIPLQWPDDDDLIRPDAEEELVRVAEAGSLTRSGGAPLGKHLVWTFGPLHRALRFPLQLRFELDGDRVITCDPEIGWTHQGLERAFTRMTFEEGVRQSARLCPDFPIAPTLAFVLAVERLCGIVDEVPVRAQLTRVLCAELSRVGAHLSVLESLMVGVSDLRARGAVVSASRTVRTLMSLLAYPDGEPILAHVGGLARDLAAGALDAVELALPDALAPVADARDALLRDPAFADGLRRRGRVDASTALRLGLSGPALRACAVSDDLRITDPVFAYGQLSPRVAQQSAGDALARAFVRWDEIQASGGLCVRAISALQKDEGKLSPGPIAVEPEAVGPRDDEGHLCPPPGRAAGGVEAPSGELLAFLDHKGGAKPHRVRWKTPSFSLVSALPTLLEGQWLDDVIPVLRSLGMSASGFDR